jgi:hypothetical protein
MGTSFLKIFIFSLGLCILSNSLVWAFSGEVFNHAIKNEHHVLSLDPLAHSEVHQHDPSKDHNNSNPATHCVHAAGQYLPFFFYSTIEIFSAVEKEVLNSFISTVFPEVFLDSPLRPPKFFLTI